MGARGLGMAVGALAPTPGLLAVGWGEGHFPRPGWGSCFTGRPGHAHCRPRSRGSLRTPQFPPMLHLLLKGSGGLC